MEIDSSHIGKPPAWKLNYRIGRGSFGAVFLEKVAPSDQKPPELWAVKRISRTLPNLPVKRYQAEIQNLRVLSNYEWFVKFYSSYEDADYVYIAMEYMPIGDISKTFVNDYRWNESDTQVVIEQLLHGLVVMHKAGITHYNLKPENVFLYLPAGTAQGLHVKIGGFSTSGHIALSDASTYPKATTGTLGYMAPEMLDTSIPKTNKVDIWSLGCILFRMFAGHPPFRNLPEVYKYAMTASTPTLILENLGFSTSCMYFLADILQPSPDDRPSAKACLEGTWIMNTAPRSIYSIGKDLYTSLCMVNVGAPNIDTFLETVAASKANGEPKPVPGVRRERFIGRDY
ncbi:kinase-like domain-containing protein [Tuber borchii]|uniref:Kinase-like domain-containing protein n=1 Tax=Tuber borchii TaxID=42251 RepID=A0A2T7A679_TUBBO|nr:kinase-like domain-containing protein [Tuber borchii]